VVFSDARSRLSWRTGAGRFGMKQQLELLQSFDATERARAGADLVQVGLGRSAEPLLDHVANEFDDRVLAAIARAVVEQPAEPKESRRAAQLRRWAAEALDRLAREDAFMNAEREPQRFGFEDETDAGDEGARFDHGPEQSFRLLEDLVHRDRGPEPSGGPSYICWRPPVDDAAATNGHGPDAARIEPDVEPIEAEPQFRNEPEPDAEPIEAIIVDEPEPDPGRPQHQFEPVPEVARDRELRFESDPGPPAAFDAPEPRGGNGNGARTLADRLKARSR
jgi:hypothetical protein